MDNHELPKKGAEGSENPWDAMGGGGEQPIEASGDQPDAAQSAPEAETAQPETETASPEAEAAQPEAETANPEAEVVQQPAETEPRNLESLSYQELVDLRSEKLKMIEDKYSLEEIYNFAKSLGPDFNGMVGLVGLSLEDDASPVAEGGTIRTYEQFLNAMDAAKAAEAASAAASESTSGAEAPAVPVSAGSEQAPVAPESTNSEQNTAAPAATVVEESPVIIAPVAGDPGAPAIVEPASGSETDPFEDIELDSVEEEPEEELEQEPLISDAERSGAHSYERKKSPRSRLKRIGVAALLAATVAGIFTGGMLRRNVPKPYENTSAIERRADVDEDDIALEGYEVVSDYELVSMEDSYHGKYTNEDGTALNSEKKGKYNNSIPLSVRGEQLFGEKAADMEHTEIAREIVMRDSIQMPEIASVYAAKVPSMQLKVDALKEYGGNLSAKQISDIIENNEEARKQLYDVQLEWFKDAKAADRVIDNETGRSSYIAYDHDGDLDDHTNLDPAYSVMTKHNANAVVFTNGNESITVLDECGEQVWEAIDTPSTTFKDSKEIPPEDNPDIPPEDIPENPTPENPVPENPVPENPTPENPVSETPPSLEQKEPEDISIPGEHTFDDDYVVTDDSLTEIKDEQDLDQHEDDSGTTQGDVDPSPDVQVGAVDTSETISADGSGRTESEVVADYDRSTVNPSGEAVADGVTDNGGQGSSAAERTAVSEDAAVTANEQNEESAAKVQAGGDTTDSEYSDSEFNASNY